MNEKAKAASIEQLRARHRELENRKTKYDTQLGTAQEALRTLKQEAMEKFGVDTLDALRALLKKLQDENNRKCAEFQEKLERIEAELARVERETAAESAPKADHG